MKRQSYAGWLLLSILLVLPVTAQVTNALTNAPTAGATSRPSMVVDFWDIGIGIVAPILIWGLAKIAPKIPKPLLPTLAPLVGVGLGFLINWLAGQNMGWFEAAKAGSMAVFFREIVNQWATKRMAEPDLVVPPAK